MSVAEFVRNVGESVTVYRWDASGLEQLNRENKISSLPFWIPNATTRHHQFRLVLLRGLVPSPSPATDPFGVLIELIPPPSSAATGEPGLASSSADFPGGCAVTCAVLPVETASPAVAASEPRSKSISSTKTVVLDEGNTQISFPDLIPAEVLQTDRYVRGSPKTMTLQITFETGISVPLHQVATTAFSFFSSLTSSVNQLLGNTAHLYHESRESISGLLAPTTSVLAGTTGLWHDAAEPPPLSAEPTSTAPPLTLSPPWELTPEDWRDRPDEWRTLVSERLAGFDGAYRHGVEKVLSLDEIALLTDVGLVEADLWACYSLFDYDRDVHEALLTSAVVRSRRYHLVPARLKEETFWANYFWKVHCLSQCVTERQVAAVLTTLCLPTRSEHLKLASTAEEMWRCILDGEEVAAVVVDFVERGEAGELWCAVAVESARHCRTLLQTLVERPDAPSKTVAHLQDTLAHLEKSLDSFMASLQASAECTGLVDTVDTAVTDDLKVSCSPAAPTNETNDQHTPQGSSPPEIPPHLSLSSPVAEAPAILPIATAGSTLETLAHTEGSPSSTRMEFVKMPWEEDEEDASAYTGIGQPAEK